MTKTFRASGREYQRSTPGAPLGALGNARAREERTSGEFRVANETERGQFFDPTFNAFDATYANRAITFFAGTPPAQASVLHGSELEQAWTYRILGNSGTDTLNLEGFRAEFAGTAISYVIHASVELTDTDASFPLNTGEGLGTGADVENRTNMGPAEWQVVHFPTAADGRLKIYPFLVTGRVSATVLVLSDQFDNIATFPAPVSNLQWHLRDRPAYTHEQLYKVIHQFILDCGWSAHQHRGKNNGAGSGGDDQNGVFCVQDWIYFSDGRLNDQAQYLRFCAFNRMNESGLIGLDSTGNFGLDWAFFSRWDRTAPSVSVVGAGTADTNPGNGINALSSHFSTTANNHWAAQADTNNLTSNSEPALAPDAFAAPSLGTPFNFHTKWGSPFHRTAASKLLRPNALNTFEGGDIQEIGYYMFGDKDEMQVYFEAPGFGSFHLGMGNLKIRDDAQPNNFATNFRADSTLGTPRLHIGGPGTANGTDPTGVTPPYQVGDRIQTVGQTINNPGSITPGDALGHTGEFVDSTTISALPGLVPAIGFINCIARSLLVDNTDVFSVDDGQGNNIQFYYDVDGLGGGVGTAIDVSTGPGAASDIAVFTRDALNASALGITSIAVGAQVQLTHNTSSGVGNVDMSETVANAGFTVEGMGGGGYAIDIAQLFSDLAAGALVGEDPQPLFFFRPHHVITPFGTNPTDGVFRVSNRSDHQDSNFRDHNGPGATAGGENSNGFNAKTDLSGLSGVDFNAANPNRRSAKFPLVTINCVDVGGGQIPARGQLRGSMRYCRVANARLGSYQFKRDRNGQWHFLVPFTNRHDSNAGEADTNQVVLALGPMPEAMAFLA